MRRLLPLLLLLAGCSNASIVAKPAEGYRALRVTESQFVPYRLGGMELRAGQVLVADRALPNGTPIFCPLGAPTDLGTCVAWDGERMTFLADGPAPTQPISIRPGTFEEFRMR